MSFLRAFRSQSLLSIMGRAVPRHHGIRATMVTLQATPSQSRMVRFASSAPVANSSDVLKDNSAEWFQKGMDYFEKERYAEALDAFEKANWSEPSSDACYNMGNVHLCLGQPGKAIESWKKSIELNPSRSDAHVNLANLYALLRKNYDKAAEYYEKAILITPDDGEIYYNFGLVLDAAQRYEQAISAFERAMELGISNASGPLRNTKAKQAAEYAKSMAESSSSSP